MNLSTYSIYDIKAEAFATPFFMVNDNVAVRAFMNMTNDPQSQVSQNTADYKLFKIGNFDSLNGTIEPEMQLLVDGLTLPKTEGQIVPKSKELK